MTLTDDDEVLAELEKAIGPFYQSAADMLIARHFYALGMAAIPREPTQAMLTAGRSASETGHGTAQSIWRAMYDAAQEKP